MKKIAEKKDETVLDEQGLDEKRRAFITTTTVVGVGVASAAILPGVATAGAIESTTESTKQQKGYQLTDHVADYYQSAAN